MGSSFIHLVRTDAFELWCWRRLQRPLDYKEIKSVNPKQNQPWIFIGRIVAEADAPVLWPPDVKSQLIGNDPDARKHWRRKEEGAAENEMVREHLPLNAHETEWTPGDSWGQKSLVYYSPCGCKESDTS